MLFNSFHFAVYFLVTTILFFLLPHRFRWAFILAISCYFYMIFKPEYILILLFTILVDYAAGILIESQPKHKFLYLWLSIIVNVGFLAFFKYWNFFNENLTVVLDQFGIRNQVPYLSILLPIGLSFHTFQAMAYTIEVYRGNQKAERHLGIYALYVMFYPQLVAGPIERPQNTIHQFREKVDFDYDRVVDGLRQALWGLFKKVVIADRLAVYVDPVFRFPEHHSGLTCLIASLFFMFQIYCDFSGYSDIALGTARVLGVKLMTNFNFPLFSRNVSELWRRWHISLSTWFNDYLFTPTITVLRNWGKWAVVFGLMLTFFTSGLWHGAGWTYIIFGVMNGVAVTYEFLTKKTRKKFFKKLPDWAGELIGVLFTFSWFVLAHIFFRAAKVGDALIVIRNIFTWKDGSLFIGNAAGFVYSVAGILFLLAADVNEKILHNRYSLMYSSNGLLRKVSYVFLIILILGVGVFNGGQFIYFQF